MKIINQEEWGGGWLWFKIKQQEGIHVMEFLGGNGQHKNIDSQLSIYSGIMEFLGCQYSFSV